MVSDRLIEWMEGEGYDYEYPLTEGEEGRWVESKGRDKGMGIIERESKIAFEKPEDRTAPKRIQGLAAALPKINEYINESATDAIDEAYSRTDTKREFKEFSADKIVESARGKLGKREKLIRFVGDDIERIVAPSKTIGQEFVDRIESARTSTERDKIITDYEVLKDERAKKLVEQVTGIRGKKPPVTVVTAPGVIVIVTEKPAEKPIRKPSKSWDKMEDRIKDVEIRQKDFIDKITPQDISVSKATSIKSIARFYEFKSGEKGTVTPEDERKVAELLNNKGIPLKTTPSGKLSIDKKTLKEQIKSSSS